MVAGETTKVIGTLAAVYGWLMPPIGWGYAAAVWGYAILWFVISDVAKMAVYRIEQEGPSWHARRWARLNASLHHDSSMSTYAGHRRRDAPPPKES